MYALMNVYIRQNLLMKVKISKTVMSLLISVLFQVCLFIRYDQFP